MRPGHFSLLSQARRACDRLIVGLNSDGSVARLKGPERPVQNEAARATVLASLSSVDLCVIFDDDTPYDLINAIKPHTLVKGGDYEGKDVVGQDIAEELKLIQFVDGKSTTKTIEKIQHSK